MPPPGSLTHVSVCQRWSAKVQDLADGHPAEAHGELLTNIITWGFIITKRFSYLRRTAGAVNHIYVVTPLLVLRGADLENSQTG